MNTEIRPRGVDAYKTRLDTSTVTVPTLKPPKITLSPELLAASDKYHANIQKMADKYRKKQEQQATGKSGQTLKLVGQGLDALSLLIPDAETALNVNNDMATSARKGFQTFAMSSGNPYLIGAAVLSGISDKVGGTASASKTGNLWTDIGNAAASFVPFLGFAGKDVGKFVERDDVNASSMYSNIGDVYGARSHSGGKFLFGAGGIKNKIDDSNMKSFTISNNILQPGKRDLMSAMDERWGVSALFDLSGGYDQTGFLRAKLGAVLQFTKRVISKNKIKKLLNGGLVVYTTNGPEIHLTRSRTLDELVSYVEQLNPEFWKRMSGEDKNYIVNPDGSYSSLLMSWGTDDDGNAIVYPLVQYNDNNELQIFSDEEAYRRAIETNNYVVMTPDEAEDFTSHYKESEKLNHIYTNYLNYVGEFKAGGKVNVIPEGALHAHKHHLTDIDTKFEDVTTKGIPVIVESGGGEVILQAEVEKEEIIFRLEVTKKLEELSKKHTDEAAIEAGKLLVFEILHNTIDKTNNML